MRVLLADDHPLFLDGLENMLTARGFEVLGTAQDGLEALAKARALHPEMILLDIQMPRLDGLAALRLIKSELPATKIVMLTMSADDENLFEALKSGASGYLLKTQATREFFDLLAEVERGEVVLSPGLAARVLKEFGNQGATLPDVEAEPGLSTRELEVLAVVAQGLTYKEAGAKLFLSERTIKFHMGAIIERLHLRKRSEVIQYALRTGLVR